MKKFTEILSAILCVAIVILVTWTYLFGSDGDETRNMPEPTEEATISSECDTPTIYIPETTEEETAIPPTTAPETTEETTEPPTTEVETTETETEPPTTVIPTTEAPKPTEEYYPLYKVNGAMLDADLQRWTYVCCKKNGVEWLTPYIIAQFYQESRFNQGSVSSHQDYGLGQLWIGNHDWLRQELGKPNADFINNPYDNIEGAVWMMTRYLAFRGNLNGALESYFNCGDDAGNKEYVQQVSQWFDKIEKIR